jgi:hypothetical protein
MGRTVADARSSATSVRSSGSPACHSAERDGSNSRKAIPPRAAREEQQRGADVLELLRPRLFRRQNVDEMDLSP